MTSAYGYSHIDTSAHGFATSNLFYDPRESPDALPLITSGALRYPSIPAAMAGAEDGQPEERITKWNRDLTNGIGELSDWRFGTVQAVGYSAIAIVHPAAVAHAYDVIASAWSLVIRRNIAPEQRARTSTPLDELTEMERYQLLQSTPAPKLLTQKQADHANRVRTKAGHAPITLERLNTLVTTRWQRAQAEARAS